MYFKGYIVILFWDSYKFNYNSKQTCKCISIIKFGNKDHSNDTMNVIKICYLLSMPGFPYVSTVTDIFIFQD